MQKTPDANPVCLTFYMTDIFVWFWPIKFVHSPNNDQATSNKNVKFLRSDSNVGDFNTLFIVDKRQANTLKI